ncbi:MAG: 3-deoxy-D-manno-octulosonic acid transferase [Nevskiaceae bacterium]|nr:MAG: 3-deoxy-D-manno-octulosonic acid transferase [Nevskiaceae bacterium]TBR72807.1 MAG: 3-deoxy-D-manno-octulosonic acid transferase [Nevskiaceae bacterium]
MRLLYICLLYLAGPFVLWRLWWRGRRQPEYRQRIGERLGCVALSPVPIAVWVHAVSVGESVAAFPLIEVLLARHGEGQVWVTTTTPTGSARIVARFGTRVRHSYAPYDWPGAVARFVARVRPQCVVVMETELWPNLFRHLARRGVPLVIANARLSPRSFRGYSHLRRSMASVLNDCRTIAAQSEADAGRFRQLGARRVQAVGNLKFDLVVRQAQLVGGQVLRAACGSRPTWVAASTHEGEETLVLEAHRQVRERFPDALLILVPRHPERFDAVAAQVARAEFVTVRRSAGEAVGTERTAAVLLGDTMGEMFTYLAAADVAFVGGSLVPVGGHNVLEPAALGLPVLFGPHMHNFEAARALLLEREAACEVRDAEALAAAVQALFADPGERQHQGEAGRAAVSDNRGTLERLLAIVDDCMKGARSA